MRLVVIGAVAAGTSAAAKARRNNEDAEIIIYEKDTHISYSSCGMPYYIGDIVETAEELYPRDEAFFKSKYNVDVLTKHEVLSINPEEKSLEVKNLTSGVVFKDKYDKLIISTGASAVIPPIKGVDGDNVFKLRTINDMIAIKTFIEEKEPKTVVIIGTGFIGLEICENLKLLGLDVTMIGRSDNLTSGIDKDMTGYIKDHIIENGVNLLMNENTVEITKDTVILESGKNVPADMVIVSTGAKPNIKLAEDAGVAIGETGAIKVNKRMQTNVEDIYACGDCAEQYNVITGKSIYRPMGTTANKMGRIAGDVITGGDLEFRGVLGTSIFKIFDMAVAQTGLSEKDAKNQGFNVEVSHNIKPDRPKYMGGKEMVIKSVADRNTGRLLGVQIVGYDGVDKRIDVFVTAITMGVTVDDLFHLDLAYAPPFSTTKDPVMYTGMILENAISRERGLMTDSSLDELVKSGDKYKIIDARAVEQFDEAHVENAESLPHGDIRAKLDDLDKDTVTITYCNAGTTGNAAQNILINRGFKKVYNLSGGHKQYLATHKKKNNED